MNCFAYVILFIFVFNCCDTSEAKNYLYHTDICSGVPVFTDHPSFENFKEHELMALQTYLYETENFASDEEVSRVFGGLPAKTRGVYLSSMRERLLESFGAEALFDIAIQLKSRGLAVFPKWDIDEKGYLPGIPRPEDRVNRFVLITNREFNVLSEFQNSNWIPKVAARKLKYTHSNAGLYFGKIKRKLSISTKDRIRNALQNYPKRHSRGYVLRTLSYKQEWTQLLSPRMLQVASLRSQGYSNQEIGIKLSISNPVLINLLTEIKASSGALDSEQFADWLESNRALIYIIRKRKF